MDDCVNDLIGVYNVQVYLDTEYFHEIQLQCDHTEINTYKKFYKFLKYHCNSSSTKYSTLQISSEHQHEDLKITNQVQFNNNILQLVPNRFSTFKLTVNVQTPSPYLRFLNLFISILLILLQIAFFIFVLKLSANRKQVKIQLIVSTINISYVIYKVLMKMIN